MLAGAEKEKAKATATAQGRPPRCPNLEMRVFPTWPPRFMQLSASSRVLLSTTQCCPSSSVDFQDLADFNTPHDDADGFPGASIDPGPSASTIDGRAAAQKPPHSHDWTAAGRRAGVSGERDHALAEPGDGGRILGAEMNIADVE